MLQRVLLMSSIISVLTGSLWAQVDRKAKVENDRRQFRQSTEWIYNDLSQALTAAKSANKPVLVVLRCIP